MRIQFGNLIPVATPVFTLGQQTVRPKTNMSEESVVALEVLGNTILSHISDQRVKDSFCRLDPDFRNNPTADNIQTGVTDDNRLFFATGDEAGRVKKEESLLLQNLMTENNTMPFPQPCWIDKITKCFLVSNEKKRPKESCRKLR